MLYPRFNFSFTRLVIMIMILMNFAISFITKYFINQLIYLIYLPIFLFIVCLFLWAIKIEINLPYLISFYYLMNFIFIFVFVINFILIQYLHHCLIVIVIISHLIAIIIRCLQDLPNWY
jgi:hypothetical protein